MKEMEEMNNNVTTPQQEYWRRIREREMYKWHPLFEDVCHALDIFAMTLTRAWRLQLLPEKEYDFYYSTTDFNVMLAFLKKSLSKSYEKVPKNEKYIENLLKKFSFLDINCHKSLILFKYKKFIALADMGVGNDFFDLYDGLYRECRSVVIDISGPAIVLAPQSKFFNINENEEWSYDNIQQRIATAANVEITNKLDGSNQNFRYYKGEIVGSGSSAIDPEVSWRLKKGYSLLSPSHKQMLMGYPDFTFMFEFISPDNQVVVAYTKEQEGLYLFGMRNVYTGEELPYSEVLNIAHNYQVPTTEMYNETLDSIMTQLDNYSCNDKEGWVIGIPDPNTKSKIFKAKVKITDYVLMHKAISKIISPNAIIQAIAEGKWDDFSSKIPTAYKDNAQKVVDVCITYIATTAYNVNNYITQAKHELWEDYDNTKSFMLWAQLNVPKDYLGYVIAVYKGKQVNYLRRGAGGYKKLNELRIPKAEVN